MAKLGISADTRRFFTDPIIKLDLMEVEISSIIWATAITFDFGWLRIGTFDEEGRQSHVHGMTKELDIHFLGLPLLS